MPELEAVRAVNMTLSSVHYGPLYGSFHLPHTSSPVHLPFRAHYVPSPFPSPSVRERRETRRAEDGRYGPFPPRYPPFTRVISLGLRPSLIPLVHSVSRSSGYCFWKVFCWVTSSPCLFPRYVRLFTSPPFPSSLPCLTPFVTHEPTVGRWSECETNGERDCKEKMNRQKGGEWQGQRRHRSLRSPLLPYPILPRLSRAKERRERAAQTRKGRMGWGTEGVVSERHASPSLPHLSPTSLSSLSSFFCFLHLISLLVTNREGNRPLETEP